jgi:hypothetical protein
MIPILDEDTRWRLSLDEAERLPKPKVDWWLRIEGTIYIVTLILIIFLIYSGALL